MALPNRVLSLVRWCSHACCIVALGTSQLHVERSFFCIRLCQSWPKDSEKKTVGGVQSPICTKSPAISRCFTHNCYVQCTNSVPAPLNTRNQFAHLCQGWRVRNRLWVQTTHCHYSLLPTQQQWIVRGTVPWLWDMSAHASTIFALSLVPWSSYVSAHSGSTDHGTSLQCSSYLLRVGLLSATVAHLGFVAQKHIGGSRLHVHLLLVAIAVPVASATTMQPEGAHAQRRPEATCAHPDPKIILGFLVNILKPTAWQLWSSITS